MTTLTTARQPSWQFDRSATWLQAVNRGRNAVIQTVFSAQAVTDLDTQLEKWASEAMKVASTSEVDGYFVAEVPGIPEAWVDGATAAEALAALPDVLMDWAELALEGGHTVPSFGGVDLNP